MIISIKNKYHTQGSDQDINLLYSALRVLGQLLTNKKRVVSIFVPNKQ